ncbi:hypothetical protein ACFX5U_18640 [Sphingobacterium sp. SG20118]|uniref:hypothetical protein n=1 Tax=Sphingobacterium sp. SG20118 TaxID=3367156 RepID=UPI0037DFC90D
MNIWNKLSAVVFMSALSAQVFAQIPDKVGSLISADKEAALISKTTTPHQAFLSIIDKESKFFVPSEVNALDYLNNRPNIPDVMTWETCIGYGFKKSRFWDNNWPYGVSKGRGKKTIWTIFNGLEKK